MVFYFKVSDIKFTNKIRAKLLTAFVYLLDILFNIHHSSNSSATLLYNPSKFPYYEEHFYLYCILLSDVLPIIMYVQYNRKFDLSVVNGDLVFHHAAWATVEHILSHWINFLHKAHWLINLIDTKCRHLKNGSVKGLCGRCLSKFTDWRYRQSCWYFRPSVVNFCPLKLLPGSIFPPPPFPVWMSIQYTRIQ